MVRVDFFFKENIPFLEPAPKIDKTCDCPRLDLTIRLVQVNSLCFCWLPSASHGQQPTGEHGERISASLLFFFGLNRPFDHNIRNKSATRASAMRPTMSLLTDSFRFLFPECFDRGKKKRTQPSGRHQVMTNETPPPPSQEKELNTFIKFKGYLTSYLAKGTISI